MQTKSKSPVLLLVIVALVVLLLAGGGLFFLLSQAPSPATSGGSAGASGGPSAISSPSPGGPGGPSTGQTGPPTAEAGDTVVTLTWQAAPGATGYFVYRDGARNPLNLKPITETRYQDIGLSDGRTYTYTVAPVIGGAQGQRLPEVQVIPTSK
jgi:hypothetical protein